MSSKSDKKDESREKILSSAGALIKEKGMSATTVSDVMEGAGMTVGGFYAHFPSKDDLMAESVSSALCQSRDSLESAAGDKTGADWLEAFSKSYLSRAHRDNPSGGCPLPATLGEMANASDAVTQALASSVETLVNDLARHEQEAGQARPREEALATLALMIGGITLARALAGTPASDEVLKACRSHLKKSLGR